MADLAPFEFGGIGAVTGTVTATTDWVHVIGTLTIASTHYAYGRIDSEGNLISASVPGFIGIPFDPPYLIARLPTDLYGDKVIIADDHSPSTPNAMTDLDPGYWGVDADADYAEWGKFMFSQARSKWRYSDGSYGRELGVSGIARELEYPKVTTYEVSFDSGDPEWVLSDPETLIRHENNYEMVGIARGSWTYLGISDPPPPGLIIDFDIEWWRGSGFRCPLLIPGKAVSGVVPRDMPVAGKSV